MRLRIVAAVVAVTLLASCSALHKKEGASKWYASPRSDYDMVVTLDCFCDAGTFDVRVRGDLLVRAAQNGHHLELPTLSPLTVDDLFLLITRFKAVGAYLSVTYDDEWGFPTHIVADTGGSDGGMEVTVTSFQTWPRGQHP
jgi:hypothetical protein